MGNYLNWFPGHMHKTLKEIEKKIPLVDLVIEVVDARAPYSTQNMLFERILKNKKVLFVLSKTDLADPKVTEKWIDYFTENSQNLIMTMDKNSQNLEPILVKKINEATKEIQEKQRKKGIVNPQLNVLVLGLPNVGKSTFINKVMKGKTVKTGNKPGLTRGLQRIQLTKNITLIDTPGIMPTVIENELIATNLVSVNSVKEDVFPRERMASRAMTYIFNAYPGVIENAYHIKSGYNPPINIEDSYRIFEKIAKTNKWIILGDVPDVERVMQKFLRDVANGKLGRLSFETPEMVFNLNDENSENDESKTEDVTLEW